MEGGRGEERGEGGEGNAVNETGGFLMREGREIRMPYLERPTTGKIERYGARITAPPQECQAWETAFGDFGMTTNSQGNNDRSLGL